MAVFRAAPSENQTTSGSDSPGPGLRRARACVAVIAAAALAGSLVQTLVVPLLPVFPEHFHAQPSSTAWIVTVTLVSAGVTTPMLSRLGDRYGRKRLLVIAVVLLATGSACCALAPSLLWLLAGRAIQGSGMAIVPLGISLVAGMQSLRSVNTAIAVLSAVMGVGGAIGLPLAGILAQYVDFHAIFWINAAMAAVAGAAIALVVPPVTAEESGALDLLGLVTFAAFLVGAFLLLTKAPSWGITSPATVLVFICSAFGLLPFLVWVELRAERPALDIRALRIRPVVLTNTASVLAGFTMFENFYTTTQLVQIPLESGYGFGLGIAAAGLAVLPTGTAVVLCAPLSGRIVDLVGPRATMVTGLTLLGAGSLLRLTVGQSLILLATSSAVIGIGTSIAFAAMPVLVLNSTPPQRLAAATGLNTLSRTMGSAIASAVVGVVLSSSTSTVGGVVVPSHAGFLALSTAAAVSMAIAIVLILFIPRPQPSPGRHR
ncbi:MFS transporter [Rhodococcus opacus]|uniref:MFS transporter n=1 Tax=Rhodococcus opacus TaxID=37919 RepID=UPI001C467000|nr:MFS transporter [Rhodococcus opacus]MBV6761779.1 MFS transporter [Rhodococcus opacus]